MVCDWWISIGFVCFCVSRLVARDRNYDWRQWKTQLWRRLLNFRVSMFVKSAVKPFCLFVYLFSVFTFYFLVSVVVVVDLWMFQLAISVTKQNNSLNSPISSKKKKTTITWKTRRKIHKKIEDSLTRERYFHHSKIKFVSPSGHVMFCLFYRYWWNS